MNKRVVGVLCCALWVLSSGCSDECVDQFDCRRDKGQPAEGQEWVCTGDNKCEQRPIAVPDAGEPDAGVPEPDAGVPDAGVPDAGEPDAGPVDGGGQGTAGKGERCAASGDCIAGLRCEGTPLTCQAQQVVVTGRDDAGVSKALVTRYDTPGMTVLSEGDSDSRYPRWGPGGTRVSFAQGAVDTSTEKVAGDLTVRDIPLVAGQAQVLADGGSGNTESFRSMEWEPSSYIAWVRQNGSSRSGISVVTTDATGGGVVTQATTTGAFPDWAPDGTTFVYNISGEGLLTSTLGAAPTPLTSAGTTAEQAHYNHANAQLLYLANPNNETVVFSGDPIPVPLFRLYSVNVTGGGQPQVVADVSTEAATDGVINTFIASPIWSPDGTWSAYVRAYYFKPTTGDAVLCGGAPSPCETRPGNVIFLRSIDPASGTASATEVRLADDGTLPSFSPDGRFVAFIKAGQLYVQQIDPTTGASVNPAIVHPKGGYTLQTSDSDDHRPRWQPR